MPRKFKPISPDALFDAVAQLKPVRKVGQHHWHSAVPLTDDFGEPITTTFIDGATRYGAWAIMSPASHDLHGVGLGTGKGQRYVLGLADGRWVKNAG